nr:PREDICTED: thyrotropin-releasing hormone-degrading ectoenzyme [Anolis carolinensis]|eukprot:XP_016849656.1 PREDICTED: thyrotropin-releasing hormone-degrading ectoenzyme [Anolis carolinensis]
MENYYLQLNNDIEQSLNLNDSGTLQHNKKANTSSVDMCGKDRTRTQVAPQSSSSNSQGGLSPRTASFASPFAAQSFLPGGARTGQGPERDPSCARKQQQQQPRGGGRSLRAPGPAPSPPPSPHGARGAFLRPPGPLLGTPEKGHPQQLRQKEEAAEAEAGEEEEAEARRAAAGSFPHPSCLLLGSFSRAGGRFLILFLYRLAGCGGARERRPRAGRRELPRKGEDGGGRGGSRAAGGRRARSLGPVGGRGGGAAPPPRKAAHSRYTSASPGASAIPSWTCLVVNQDRRSCSASASRSAARPAGAGDPAAARRAGNGSAPPAGARLNQPHLLGEPPREGDGDAAPAEADSEENGEHPPPWTLPRLPGHLRPLHYNLMLSVFLENFTFSGEVNVQVECLRATRYVVLHAHRLRVEAARLAEDRLAGALRVAGFFLYPQTQVFVLVLNRSLEAQRSYNLKILFHAPIENELLGFFRSSYVLYGERRFLAVTQFSPTHARKAFPCFDEPIYKATFKISIKHQATYLSLSNMPVETSVFEEDGWVTDHFSQTPLMSTYYLAWAVCNFTYRETMTKNGVVIRLYARPDAIRRGSGDYALNITRRLIEFYEDYFRMPYSLPKLDLLAVPKHPYAAMENWGLSVFVEQRILLDPSISSISYLLDVTMVIVHELCHQWFGDLVTPVWWEDVWLKEGFAHYFEFVGTDYLYPGWNLEKQRFLTDVLHEVMLLDGLASSHPVSQEVQQATDIDRVFDWIAYKKGAALIRMLANFMGHSVFQMGLQDYLTIHKYGNAARKDLWNTLSEALRKVGKFVNIQVVMDQWTLQMGYPVITIMGNETTDNIVGISQEHFIYDLDVKTKDSGLGNNSYLWQIPLTIAVGNTSHISSEAIIWVSNKSGKNKLSSQWNLIKHSCVFLNCFFTVDLKKSISYAKTYFSLDKVCKKKNPLYKNCQPREKEMNHAIHVEAGYLPQNIPLELLRYLSKEKEFLPWHAASRALYPLDKLLDRTENYNIFNEYILRQVASMYLKLGWPTNNVDKSFVQASYQHEELRREVIMLACSFGNKHCHQQAATLISDWISSNRNRIPLNVRDIVYCTGVSLMDEDVWEFIWMKFHSTTAVSEKKILLEALTCSDDRNLLNRLLNLSLNSEVVLDQDAIDVIIHVARNPHGRDLAWKFFREKWKILNARYGEALFMNSKLISGVTEFLNTESELNELKNFIKTHEEGSAASFSRAVETVEANVRWQLLYKEELFQWLRKSLAH